MNKLLISTLLLPFWFLSLYTSTSLSEEGVVHAVLFYSPGCGHCYIVITEELPPLFERYGDQLYIVGVDITQPAGQELFLLTLQYFNLESGGVPFLVVGDTYLVGSVDIPEKFPDLIEQYLAQGGVDWPAISGLAEVLIVPRPTEIPTVTQPSNESTPTSTTTIPTPTSSLVTPTPTSTSGLLLSSSHTSKPENSFTNDPLGNSLSVFILGGMILSIGGVILFFRRFSGSPVTQSWGWAIPLLCVLGLGVAGYLAYVETTQVNAICGPVGDCNTVQQSEYTHLFGVIPIGVLGLLGYLAILLSWLVSRFGSQRIAVLASLALLGLTFFGTLFSIYLTFLEPFVIGATCSWCLSSAIIMTILLWLSSIPGKVAISRLRFGETRSPTRSRI